MEYKVGEQVVYYWQEKKASFLGTVMKRLRVLTSGSKANPMFERKYVYKYELQLSDYQGGGWSVTAYERSLKKVAEPVAILKEMLA